MCVFAVPCVVTGNLSFLFLVAAMGRVRFFVAKMSSDMLLVLTGSFAQKNRENNCLRPVRSVLCKQN